MAETPTIYMPDYPVQWTPQQMRGHRTEMMESRSGREQRRGVYVSAGRRRYVAKSSWFIDSPDDRRSLFDFFQLMRGKLTPFNFWQPSPITLINTGTLWTFGTNGGGDTWHATLPYKGPYTLGKSPVASTYQTIGGTVYAGEGSPATATAAASVMSIPPRGNGYVTHRFNGFNQFATAGAAANTRIAGDQTWATWVFLRPLDVFALWIIADSEVLNTSGVLFWIDSNRKINFRTDQAGANTTGLSTGAVPLNTWHHVAVVRSGTTITFYIDGVAAGTATGITNPVTATASLTLGGVSGSSFHGAMNDLRVYSAALSAADILNIYNGNLLYDSAAGPFGSLQGLWHMTEGKTATTFVDSSPNTYNAPITNASDDSWIGGEDEIAFSGAQPATFLSFNQIASARPRIQARFDMDEIPESFLQSSGIYPAFDIAIREVI